ncbi:rCG26699 [Rattus norvegicus]|uniref:RCG26699 n=1 Tax=Rattus norvegicus TaxID=10116 RepID=A6HPM2_RAT|nr:rCG26699 [Rattus norvegicus]
MTRLSDTRVLVLGGRLSPVNPASGALQLDIYKSEDNCPEGQNVVVTKAALEEGSMFSVFFLRPVSSGFLWESIHIQPSITPRYSHTAHVFNGKLLLVGGVWIHSSSVPGVTVISLTTGLSSEYQIDTASVPWPLMLHNHSSALLPEEQQLLLIGGGGNCFSFGTYFNPHTVGLDLSSLGLGQ